MGCKREHDDVVGGKYRQHGYKRIEQHEQPQLVCILALQHGDGQMAEESCAIQKDGDQCHRKEQHENFKRVDAALRGKPCKYLPRGDRTAKHQNGSAEKRNNPEDIHVVPFDPHRGLHEHNGDKRRAGHWGNSSHKVHTNRLPCKKRTRAVL